MYLKRLLIAAAALIVPGHALAEPLCATLHAVVKLAKQDKNMASLATGPELDHHQRLATRQIDGFKCMLGVNAISSVRTFYQCTTDDSSVGPATIDAAAKCLNSTPVVENKGYAMAHSFDLQATPHIWFVANRFAEGRFTFSIITE